MIIGNPLVSIICTSYNNPMVEMAIKSALAQTYKNFELILLDDNSNKKTLDIYKKFNDPRIIYYNSHIKEKDRMKICPYARQINVGLKMAKGKLVTYMCDDTVYLPDKLEKMVRFLKRHPLIKVCYNRQRRELYEGKIKKGAPFNILAPDRILKDAYCRVDHNSVMHYKSCTNKVGYWDTMFEKGTKSGFAIADAFYWRKLNTRWSFYPIREILEINYIHEGGFTAKTRRGEI